jgi:hypothetical protein
MYTEHTDSISEYKGYEQTKCTLTGDFASVPRRVQMYLILFILQFQAS